jgi:hypothetical protein
MVNPLGSTVEWRCSLSIALQVASEVCKSFRQTLYEIVEQRIRNGASLLPADETAQQQASQRMSMNGGMLNKNRITSSQGSVMSTSSTVDRDSFDATLDENGEPNFTIDIDELCQVSVTNSTLS